jgi:hypothetical protein
MRQRSKTSDRSAIMIAEAVAAAERLAAGMEPSYAGSQVQEYKRQHHVSWFQPAIVNHGFDELNGRHKWPRFQRDVHPQTYSKIVHCLLMVCGRDL